MNSLGLPARVQANVEVRGGAECWPWRGNIHARGYGKSGTLGKHSTTRWAHRIVLEAKLGRALLAGMETLHSCHVRRCCNPAHLREGTHADNVRDCRDAGHMDRAGEANGRAKLTAEMADFIRRSYFQTSDLAWLFGIAPTNVRQIKRGRSWAVDIRPRVNGHIAHWIGQGVGSES